jgi:hypothetical protein
MEVTSGSKFKDLVNSLYRYPISTCVLSPGPLPRLQLSNANTLRRVYSAGEDGGIIVAEEEKMKVRQPTVQVEGRTIEEKEGGQQWSHM